jgi:hypothetical protein
MYSGGGDSNARSFPPVLNVAYPAVQDIRGPEGLSSLWHGKLHGLLCRLSSSQGATDVKQLGLIPPAVFSKCKGSLQDGPRLENISWR